MEKKAYLILQRKDAIILPLIYIILTLAVFSDILRVPGTSLTFFRLSVPLACLIIMLYPVWFKRLAFGTCIFIFINVILNIIFYGVYRRDLQFQITEFIKYSVLYILIFLVIALICIAKEISSEFFKHVFVNWLCIIGIIIGIISVLNLLFPDFFGALPMDNRNNYSCYLTAVFPIYLLKIEKSKKVRYVLAAVASVVIIYLNDSKASLFGILIQIAIWICISSGETKRSFILHRLILPLGMALLTGAVIIYNPSINGYSLQSVISDPLGRILTNNPYPVYTISAYYRTNTTLFAINLLGHMKGIGLGAGNLGFVLKTEFPDLNPYYLQALSASSLSLHNAWLEFMVDFGLIGIILLLIPLWYAIKKYFGQPVLNSIEKITILFVFSFPIWLIGPSGAYTQYFLFCVITYLILQNRSDNKVLRE